MYYAVTERMKALYASKQRQTVNISVELKDGSTIDFIEDFYYGNTEPQEYAIKKNQGSVLGSFVICFIAYALFAA